MADVKDEYELFGNYLILDHLVDGGMAKICRAFQLTEQESRIVAIKMVQPQYSKDDSFKQMFDDEVRLTFQLHHPNIVQIIDSGMYNEQLFVSMEYLDGRNLKEYSDKIKKIKDGEFKGFFPPSVAANIVSDVCFALHYAHNFTDKLTGQKANIIHRDISPHNIMLNFDGTVKVIDFGIAKSEKSSEATQAGTIKGKLSYLAPEYLEGDKLDHRYDQFAVGITLWELLTGQKLFKAANDLAVLKKIQECKIIPPSKINPAVPKELDLIVLKALQKNREKRFKDMQDFGDTLKVFLYKKYPQFSSKQTVHLINSVFKDEIRKDRERLFRFGKIDVRKYFEMIRSGTNKSTISNSAQKKQRSAEVVLDFGFEEEKTKSAIKSNIKGSTKSAVAKPNTKVSASPSEKTEVELEIGDTNTKKQVSSSKTRTNVTSLNKNPRKSGTSVRQIKKKEKSSAGGLIAAAIAGVVAYGGYQYFEGQKGVPNVAGSTSTTVEDDSNRVPSQVKEMGSLLITNYERERHKKIFVNGKQVSPDIIGAIEVPLNQEVTVRVETNNRRHFIHKATYSEKTGNELVIKRMPFAYYGVLITSSRCVFGNISFNLFGEQRVESLPITKKYGIRLATNVNENGKPAPKEYTLYYKRDGESLEKSLKVTVEDSIAVDLCKLID